MQSSPPSSPHSQQLSHRDLEMEHRVTVAEETLDRHADRMSFHERIMLALAGGLYILFQDRFPQIAALIKGAMP